MDISAAALPPSQPSVSATERSHSRFAEYRNYVAGCGMKLIEANNFGLWLSTVERIEWEAKNWEHHIFEVTAPNAVLAAGWYVHHFAPGHKLAGRDGPFTTRAEAEVINS